MGNQYRDGDGDGHGGGDHDEDGGEDRGGDGEPGCCEGEIDCTEEKIRNGQTERALKH